MNQDKIDWLEDGLEKIEELAQQQLNTINPLTREEVLKRIVETARLALWQSGGIVKKIK